MARYGIQWRSHSTDWWHDYPGSFQEFASDAEAKGVLAPMLDALIEYSKDSTEWRAIKVPKEVEVMNW